MTSWRLSPWLPQNNTKGKDRPTQREEQQPVKEWELEQQHIINQQKYEKDVLQTIQKEHSVWNTSNSSEEKQQKDV